MAASRINRFALSSAALALVSAANAAAAETAAETSGYEAGQEIVVTAQKREQRLRDVPIAISALSGGDLETAAIQDIADLSQVTPAVSGASNSSAQPLIAIRGIVSNDFSIGADPALGIYIDEVYTGRSAGAVQELVDIDRIEVVKGPQGTLFGRNTTAGAISIITPKPNLSDLSGRVGLAYGNHDQFEASAILNVPLAEDVAFRASAVHRSRDGVFANFLGGRLDAISRTGGRGALRWNPNADTDIILTLDGERDREDPTIAKSLSIEFPGDPDFGTVKGDFAINAPIRNDRNKYGVTLRGEFGLGDYSLTSITAARGYSLRYLEDTDGSYLTQVHFGLREKQDAFSQELRLNSPGDGALRWFVGASLYHEKVSARSQATYDEDAVCTGLAGTSFPIDCDTVLRLTPSPDPSFASAFDLLFALGAISDPYVGALAESESNVARGNYLSWGVYGDVTLELAPGLEITAGGRYSRDRKRIRIAAPATLNTMTLVNGGNVFLRAGEQRATEGWGQFQPRFVINYKPNDDLLTYASVTRGYKAGGFNVLQPGDAAFDPEQVTQYEVGSKGVLFDGRVQFDLAAFIWRYSDLQVQVFEGGLPVVRNAGRARGKGLEASLSADLGGGLELTGSAAILVAEYRSFTPAPGIDYSGNRLALAPKFSGQVGAAYTASIGKGELRTNLNYRYQSGVYFTPENGVLRQDGYGLLSGRIGYLIGGVEVALRGENLTNKRYATSGQAIGAINLAQLRAGQPRLYAVQLGFRW